MATRSHPAKIRLWFRQFWDWLSEARRVWIVLGTLLIAVVVVWQIGASEKAVRLAGLVLQVLGIGTVAVGIRDTRSVFGHPSLCRRLMEWFGRFPVYGGREVVIGMGATSLGMAGLRARVLISAPPGTASLESRVEALEKNLNFLRDEIDALHHEAEKNTRRLTEGISEEKQERVAEDQKLGKRLESATAGGLHISAMGVTWLFAGVTLSTASLEIAGWLK